MHICPEDRRICASILETARERGECTKPISTLVVATARLFLGAPYEAGSLERGCAESLVVNLRTFDCMTLVENALVLAGLIRRERTAFEDYLAALEHIRYRRGRCDGYDSRLHYFTDWLRDNAQKGLVSDITGTIGGIPFRKPLHALTSRREDRPALLDPRVYRRMVMIEGRCSRRTLRHIPKADIERAEGKIDAGDIIAITTDKTGLDVSHVGIAVRIGERLHLLHASSRAGRVIVSEVTLVGYLMARRSRAGVIVGRALPPEPR